MFKFDFNIEEDKNEVSEYATNTTQNETEDIKSSESPTSVEPPAFIVFSIEKLASQIDDLPPLISYSPLRIPLSGHRYLTLLRRDLFDARFQMISEGENTPDSNDLGFIDAPSDLVPGVYEGGLKTWECSVDLAAYLDTLYPFWEGQTHKVLELGCGTAIPSLAILRKAFSTPPSNETTGGLRWVFHLQDYNEIVLKLVTLPNIILTWYYSPASKLYRSAEDLVISESDVSEPGELLLAPELFSAFQDSLRDYKIEVNLVAGSWSNMEVWLQSTRAKYDIILSSETIYRMASLPSLISVLQTASEFGQREEGDDTVSQQLPRQSFDDKAKGICLVAAKVVYFGVGGGIDGFLKAVEGSGGRCKTVVDKPSGVSRRILQVIWDHAHAKSS